MTTAAIHAGTALPRYASRRSTCITVSRLSCFRRTTTRPLSRTLVISTGPYHWNCNFVSRSASGPCHYSHVSDAMPHVAIPHWRDGTPLANRPGALPHTRSRFASPRPAPRASRRWLGSEVSSADPASSCRDSPPCLLRE